MKRKKRILPLALAGVMTVGCLTGCSGAESESNAASVASASESYETAETANIEPEAATYPLSEEPVTLTIYKRDSSNGVIADYNEMAGYKAAFERLGVNVEFIFPAVGSEADQFNLMIASGEYPDIIMWDYNSTPMSLAEMVDSGVLIDMDPYIRQYAPNYLKVLEENEQYAKEATADNGHLLAIYSFNDDLPVSGGPTIRADLLEEYGLEAPVTVDDWTNVMTTLKEKDPDVEYPLTNGKNRDGSVWFDSFMSPYLTSNTFCLDENGQVVFGPSTENFKNYLTQLNTWYAAGLIDPEFMSNDSTAMNGKLTDGRSVCAPNMQLSYHIGNITKAARETNPDFEFVGCQWPVLNEGDEPAITMTSSLYFSGGQAAISSSCEDPVLATKFLDYFFSEEGENFLCWGIEGESYEIDENGEKHFTDAVMNDPDGKTPQEAILAWAHPQYGFSNIQMREPYVEIITTLPEQKAARETWLDASNGVMLPRLALPADVQSDYTMLMNDINTYVQEMYVQFITGQTSIEDGWETYINTLNGMGLETATQYMADAYALYQQR